eukprot:gene6664-6888_t
MATGAVADGNLSDQVAVPDGTQLAGAPSLETSTPADNQDDLVQPCSCNGTVKHAHLECLKSWVQERQQLECELCGKPYKSNVKQHLTPLLDSSSRRLRYSRLESTLTGTSSLRAGAAGGDSPALSPAPPVVSWTRFWIHLAILVMLLVAVLYLALFVPVNTSDNFWLMFLWRAITIILPLFLIIRCVAALYAWRRAYVASRATGANS